MTKAYGPIDSLHKDCIVPVPKASGGEGSFGNALPGEGPAPTGGIMNEVQMADITGEPKAGAKQPGAKIPGGGTY